MGKLQKPTHRSIPIPVVAKQWEPDTWPPPEWVCTDSHNHMGRGNRITVGIGGPHIHASHLKRRYQEFEFINSGEWGIWNLDGSFVGVMTDFEFWAVYSPEEAAND